MKATPLLNNFTSGEWSPLLEGRSDLEQYGFSAKTIENLVVLPYGGVTKLPGTHFVAEVKDSSKKIRLIPFKFNVTQAYVIEVGNEYLRFFMDHGQIMDGAVPYEIVSPYAEADIPYLQFAQEADVMYITHASYPPKKLGRTAHDNWTLSDYVPIKGPLLPVNTDTASTITPSADTGAAITLTAVNEIFDEDQVGDFVWRIKGGYVKIVGFTSTKVVTADVMYDGDLNTGPGATDDWAEAAWSAYRGYPGSVTLYEQRLIFAYTSTQPQTVWGSASGDYEVMLIGSEDADAFLYTLASSNVIRWVYGDILLFAGTSGGVFNISSGDSALPLSPTNVVVRRHTNFGCNTIPPVKMGNHLYYVQRNNKILREYSYDFSKDAFLSLDATLLAEHILGDGVTEMAYQQSPYNLLYCVREDGELAIFTRNIIQEVMGWARLVGSGLAESLAVIPRTTGGDEIWAIFNHTIGESTKRYVEYLEDFSFSTQADAFFVHSGLSYSGAATDTVSGLDHLEGEEVAILGDGAVFPRATVDSGEVTISKECEKIHVGLPYSTALKLHKLEFGSIQGTAQGKIQRISSLTIRFFKSLGCLFGTASKQDTLPFRSTNMEMDAPPDLYTGEREMPFPGGFDKAIEIYITQEQPLPLTILSLIVTGETYES